MAQININANFMSKKIKVICVLDYYLPGYKGGGPIRSISNMQAILKDDIEIDIFTRDRDLGSTNAYSDIEVNRWTNISHGRVFYATPKMFSPAGLNEAIRSEKYDILYLNSFFSLKSSIINYFYFRKAFPHLKILIAPRGEFSTGALSIKWLKKKLYICLCKLTRAYHDVSWHASTSWEKKDILQQFPLVSKNVFTADDPVWFEPDFDVPNIVQTSAKGHLKLCFISRISPMKNLDYLLHVLKKLKCKAALDIYGPIEDPTYWSICRSIISNLPKNIKVCYKGTLIPNLVNLTFSKYDLFAFPTRGENFGHVIFESLQSGTPVIISDNTPWLPDQDESVRIIDLSDMQVWCEQLEEFANYTGQEKRELRRFALKYAFEYCSTQDAYNQNRILFHKVLHIHRENP